MGDVNSGTHGRLMERGGAGERWVARRCERCALPVDHGFARFAVHCGAPRCAAYLDALEAGASAVDARLAAMSEAAS